MKIDAIGDLFIWLSSGITSASECARSLGPRTTIIVRQELAPFVESLELFDSVWPLDIKRFRWNLAYRIRMLLRLRRGGFSHVLQLRAAREFIQEDAIVRTIGAVDTRGVLGDLHNLAAWQAAISDRWYEAIAYVPHSGVHESERNSIVAQALTGRMPVRYAFRGDTPPAQEWVNQRYWVVAPGAGWLPRQWPIYNFIEIARRVTEKTSLLCIVIGTNGDIAAGLEIAAATNGRSLCGLQSISELAAIVQGAEFVLGNESGVSHMAAYFCVPSIAILGGGHFGLFMPYPERALMGKPPRVAIHMMDCFNCNWHCRFKTARNEAVPCISNVDVNTVWQEVENILKSI